MPAQASPSPWLLDQRATITSCLNHTVVAMVLPKRHTRRGMSNVFQGKAVSSRKVGSWRPVFNGRAKFLGVNAPPDKALHSLFEGVPCGLRLTHALPLCSMGGAIAVRTAAKGVVPSLVGLAVIDVVEGEQMPGANPLDGCQPVHGTSCFIHTDRPVVHVCSHPQGLPWGL